jgi:hypothetical protein
VIRAATHLGVWPFVVVALAAALVYANTLANGFVWDDHEVVAARVDPVPTSVAAVFAEADVVTKSQPAPYYRPLSRLTYLLEARLWGRAPRGYHAVNIVLHAGAAVLLLTLCATVFEDRLAAILPPLLFATHPVHSEPVNFITTRNTILATIFVLAACLAYVRARHGGGCWNDVAAVVMYFAGLLSKETSAMLPLVLAVWEYGRPTRQPPDARRVVRTFLGFLGVLGIYLVMRAAALGSIVGQSVRVGDIGRALVTIAHTVPTYLSMLVWPTSLTVLYGDPSSYVADLRVLGIAWLLVVLGVIAALVHGGWTARFGVAWFAIHFLPVSTLVAIPSAPIAERYLYLPVIGVWVMLGGLFARLSTRQRWRIPVVVLTAALVVSLVTLTTRRNAEWTDDVALFSAAIRVEPGLAVAHYNLGVALMDSGDAERARREWETTVEIEPRHADALFQLGSWYAERGSLREAESFFVAALAANPADPATHYNLGRLMEATGRVPQALAHYEQFVTSAAPEHHALADAVRSRIGDLRRRIR